MIIDDPMQFDYEPEKFLPDVVTVMWPRPEDEEEEDDDVGVVIEMNQAVNLTFSLKYLVNFAKSASLSKNVELMMSNDVPLLVSPLPFFRPSAPRLTRMRPQVKFNFGNGSISYYLAPKIGDD